MFSSDIGQLSSGRNSPNRSLSHPNSIAIRENGDRSELSFVFSPFFGDKGNDRAQAMWPSFIFLNFVEDICESLDVSA
eukprot:5148249-Heterocapsa_arctica.AAC.1